MVMAAANGGSCQGTQKRTKCNVGQSRARTTADTADWSSCPAHPECDRAGERANAELRRTSLGRRPSPEQWASIDYRICPSRPERGHMARAGHEPGLLNRRADGGVLRTAARDAVARMSLARLERRSP